MAAFAETLQAKSQFPAFALVNEEDVFLAVGVTHRGAKNVQVLGGLLARLYKRTLVAVISRRASSEQLGEPTYLNHLQRPGFHVPLALRDASHIVVDEKALGLNLQNQAISYLADVGYKLRNRFWKQVVEEIDGFDDNLVGIGR